MDRQGLHAGSLGEHTRSHGQPGDARRQATQEEEKEQPELHSSAPSTAVPHTCVHPRKQPTTRPPRLPARHDAATVASSDNRHRSPVSIASPHPLAGPNAARPPQTHHSYSSTPSTAPLPRARPSACLPAHSPTRPPTSPPARPPTRPHVHLLVLGSARPPTHPPACAPARANTPPRSTPMKPKMHAPPPPRTPLKPPPSPPLFSSSLLRALGRNLTDLLRVGHLGARKQ